MKKLFTILLLLGFSFVFLGCDLLGTTTEATTTETVTVDTENYIDITSVAELQAMEMNKSYRLMADLSLSGLEWEPIGTYADPFLGNFDGNGYTISDLTITEEHQFVLGLFGYTNGSITDLTLDEVSIDVETDFLLYVGALVGYSMGDISNNVVTNADITVLNTSSNTFVGLLVGYTQGVETTYLDEFVANSITSNEVEGSITVRSAEIAFVGGLIGKAYNSTVSFNSSNATLDVSANGTDVPVYVGGFIGHNYGGILVDFGLGAIEDTDIFIEFNISNSVITVADSTSNLAIGGFIGFNQAGVTQNNYVVADIVLTGEQSETNTVRVGGFIGENYEAKSVRNVILLSLDSSAFTGQCELDGYVAGRYTEYIATYIYLVNNDSIAIATSDDDITITIETALDLQTNLNWSSEFIDQIDAWINPQA